MTHAFEVAPDEAGRWIGAGDAPRVIDVRTPAEFAHDRIEGAVNVPVDLVEAHPAAIGRQLDGEVLLVCRADPRARRAATALADVLGPRAHVLTGGMQAWNQADLPVTKGEGGPWAMERQVRTAAGSIVLASILGSTKVSGLRWVAAGIGGGLLWSGLSDTCGMAAVLARMPWNQRQASPTLESVTAALRH